MMKKTLLTFALFVPLSAQAAGFEFLGPHGDWEVFANKTAKADVCYIASVPTQKSHADKRGDIYVLVTRRKADGLKDVVSFHQGYPLKSGLDIVVSIGSKKFKLFGSNDTAWAYDAKDDTALVKAMKAGATLKVNATSSRGTKTEDTYSLKGISAAHKAMAAACS